MAELLLGVLAMGTGVFTASAFAKLSSRRAYGDYRIGLRATRLVPGRLLDTTGVILVAVETAVAAGLAVAAVPSPATPGRTVAPPPRCGLPDRPGRRHHPASPP